MKSIERLNWQSVMFEQLLDSALGSLYWKNKQGVYLGCNKTMLEIAGFSSLEDIIGKTDFDLWPENAKEIWENDLEVINNDCRCSFEEVVKVPNGKRMVFAGIKSPLKNETGEVIGIIGNSLDITAKKEAEKLLKELLLAEKQEAEKIAIYSKQIGASIAHELRNPLATIKLCVKGIENYLVALIEAYQFAKEKSLLVPEISKDVLVQMPEALESITGESNSALVFIDMLLMKLNQQQFDQALAETSMKQCIEHALERYPFKSDEKAKVLITKDSQDFMFRGNELLMTHVLFNLLKNALYYIAAKRGENFITITLQTGNLNRLYFRDTGPGITKDILPHIFDRFFSRTQHGTGIGLAFCKMVIESFAGMIYCNSVEGEYTEFVIELPTN